jgi:two-component system, NtrC family, response regulator AtoC
MQASEAMLLFAPSNGSLSRAFADAFGRRGFRAHACAGPSDALARLENAPCDVFALDLEASGDDPLSFISELRARHPALELIVAAAGADVGRAVEVMRAGADDLVDAAAGADEILLALDKALARARIAAQHSESAVAPKPLLIGESPALKKAMDVVRKAAGGDATLLIRGETGTGKELVARAVHELGARKLGPFVAVHCAALPDNLLESELFGYEKGAFTGAVSRKPGRVELAQGGTLFLDEIGDITPATQVKLLRLLQDRQFEPLGGRRTITADVRFVAATHRDLEGMVKQGTFREDLFYRLNVVPVWLPPLRVRRADIRLLVPHFVKELGAAYGRTELSIEPEALGLLEQERWPGNVRQLCNFVERLVVLSSAPLIRAEDVRLALRDQENVEKYSTLVTHAADASPISVGPLDQKMRETERRILEGALKRADNNRTLAARLLGISRRTLYNKLEEHGLALKSASG